MPIPCPHFKITIVKRSQGQSAVAGAAYQSGERLFSEYDQRTKFYNKKKELVHAEIMLPSYAPPGYADRATLWNAVEAVENQWNSQLARRIVLAFPVEVPKEQYLSMIKEFCQEQFVSKGMIADFAIHDKGDGNPHAHILLTLRAIDEHGKWLPKARKVYDLDENGERIRLASGNWKCHKENTVDWNDQKYAEVWRHGWETITNRYLEAAGRPERVDLRSFERQGMEEIYMSRFYNNCVDEASLTTLCPICLDYFQGAKGVRVRRADPKQKIKDVCTYCQIRYGFDYYVQPDKNAGQYVKRGHFDDESECA